MRDSNSRHLRCKRSALPTELIAPAGWYAVWREEVFRAFDGFSQAPEETFPKRIRNISLKTFLKALLTRHYSYLSEGWAW